MYHPEIPDYLQAHFPKAKPASATIGKWIDAISATYYYQPTQLLLGTSLCSDDIVEIEFPESAREMLGPFHLGGLNGFPFAGLTGMKAFESHVPKEGSLTLLYGPHIGITEQGITGMVLRTGQTTASACCGAAMAALALLKKAAIHPGKPDEIDYEEDTLKQLLYARKERILDARSPEIEATRVIYEAIEERILLLLLKTDPPCRHIFGLGVIMINTDAGNPAWIQVENKGLYNRETGGWDPMPDHLPSR